MGHNLEYWWRALLEGVLLVFPLKYKVRSTVVGAPTAKDCDHRRRLPPLSSMGRQRHLTTFTFLRSQPDPMFALARAILTAQERRWRSPVGPVDLGRPVPSAAIVPTIGTGRCPSRKAATAENRLWIPTALMTHDNQPLGPRGQE